MVMLLIFSLLRALTDPILTWLGAGVSAVFLEGIGQAMFDALDQALP